jgi:hypothetical protein
MFPVYCETSERRSFQSCARHLTGALSSRSLGSKQVGRPKPSCSKGAPLFYCRRVSAQWQYRDLYPVSSLAGLEFDPPALRTPSKLRLLHQQWCFCWRKGGKSRRKHLQLLACNCVLAKAVARLASDAYICNQFVQLCKLCTNSTECTLCNSAMLSIRRLRSH